MTELISARDAKVPLFTLAELFSEEKGAKPEREQFQGKIVRVRGFWYPVSANEGILAPEPDLKSCCVRAPSKINRQLVVKGPISAPSFGRAVTIEGVLKSDLRSNPESGRLHFFVLEKAVVVPEASSGYGVIGLAFVVFLFFIWRFFFKS